MGLRSFYRPDRHGARGVLRGAAIQDPRPVSAVATLDEISVLLGCHVEIYVDTAALAGQIVVALGLVLTHLRVKQVHRTVATLDEILDASTLDEIHSAE